MDPVPTAAYVVNALEIARAFLNRAGRDKEIEYMYDRLIAQLKRYDVVPPVLLNQLEQHSKIEKKELEEVLLRRGIGGDGQIIEVAKMLIERVEQENAKLYAHINEQMTKAYKWHLEQAAQWSRFSIIVTFLGLLVIVVGIFLTYFTNITTGIVVTISGIAINLTSALFFRQAAAANEQANSKYKKLVELEEIQSSIKILSSIEAGANSTI